ncbi:hypothetical protein A5722_14815 [Mycobacterium vulneris]|nr:hypothetical protein A5722_14815 [Mycolicibacterium vulneris]OCB66201.1 hypothetical protein A5729_12320 [Mycolicibacterium vulneris]
MNGIRQAKQRIISNLILAAIVFGASIAAAFRYPAGWLIVGACIAGFVCGWIVFGALVAYGQQRARQRLAEQFKSQAHKARLVQALQRMKAPAPDSESEPT